jgi:alkylation response protein AidB-like acyl-CoA dehydrogenase
LREGETVDARAAMREAIGKLAAKARARAREIDELRSLPPDLYAELKATGVFHALTPRSHGGAELPLSAVHDMIFDASRANGSLGWMVMVGMTQGPGFGLLPRDTALRLLRGGTPPTIRGTIAPKGIAVPADGGFRVTGRWPFASGGPETDLVAGNCLVYRDGKPALNEDGVPDARICILPASQATFIDTWHALGMRGTDSRDVAFEDVFVPTEMTYNIFTTRSHFETPHTYLPVRLAYALAHAAIALGIAQGALDEIAELAPRKRPAIHPGATLAHDPVFRHELGENSLRVAAGRAFLERTTEDCWQAGTERRRLSPREILTARSMSAFVTEQCIEVVNWTFAAAGSESLYDTSPIQRRLRDIQVARQHATVSKHTYQTLGATVLGESVSPMELF